MRHNEHKISDWDGRVLCKGKSYVQELLSASNSDRAGNGDDGWKMLAFEDGVEISKCRTAIELRFGRSTGRIVGIKSHLDAVRITTAQVYVNTALM
ncbi:hypothetical protein Tco_1341053, partial [Tanacetum coccineum]